MKTRKLVLMLDDYELAIRQFGVVNGFWIDMTDMAGWAHKWARREHELR